MKTKLTRPLIMAIIFVILLPLSAAAGSKDATTMTCGNFRDVFNTLLKREESGQQPEKTGALSSFTVENFNCQPRTIEVPPGEISYKTISRTMTGQPGRHIIRLAILINGHEETKVELSGDLQIFGNVVCLSHTLQRHSIISAADVEIIQRNTSMLGADFIANPQLVIGRELKATLRTGAVIYGKLLKNPTLIKRGALVSIRAISGDLSVTAAGQTKNSGALGDIIRVKNLMSRREIYAKITGPNEVQVNF